MVRVYVPGVFDVFHIGHLNYLKAASEKGDYLIVAVQDDREVERQKGSKIVNPLPERVALIEELRFVDQVISYRDVFQGPLLAALKVDVFACGEEYGATDQYPDQKRTLAFCEEHGIKVVHIPRTPHVSSTSIRERLKNFWSSRAAKERDLPAGVTVLGSFGGDQEKIRLETQREVDEILSAVGEANHKSLLDLACGDGRLLAPLCGHFDSAVGVDYSQELLDIAQRKLAEQGQSGRLVLEDASAYVDKDTKYDVFLLSGLLPCLDDLQVQRLMVNLDLMAKPGSLLIVRSTIGLERRINVINQFSVDLQSTYTAYYRTDPEMRLLFRAGGWTLVSDKLLYQNREDSAVWWYVLKRS